MEKDFLFAFLVLPATPFELFLLHRKQNNNILLHGEIF